MKKLILTAIAVFGLASLATIQAKIVHIPDSIFKAELVNNPSINTNGDTEIQVSEAVAFTGMVEVWINYITDLTGIEAFTEITGLMCWSNRLTSLDVSKNTKLTVLDCSDNQITSIDVSNNTKLVYLSCDNNQLSSLDVSKNTELTMLWCHQNKISSLDVSNNTALSILQCYANQLTELDVSKNLELSLMDCSYNKITDLDVSINKKLTGMACASNNLTGLNVKNGNNKNFVSPNIYSDPFNATGNPNLKCIQVDDSAWSAYHWTLYNWIDTTAFFSEDCSAALDVNNIDESNALSIFPNPTQGNLFLSAHTNIVLTDLTGKVILQKQNTSQIDISELPKGLYFLSVGANLKKTFKVVKE
jgi:hypothetical protein